VTKPASENVLEFPPSDGREILSVDDARTDVLRLIQIDGLRQAAIAGEAGVSESGLSQFLKGSYRGDNNAIAEKLRNWMDLRRKRLGKLSQVPELPDWIETPTGLAILSRLELAHMQGDIAAIYGGRGLGKTKAAQRYKATAPNVFYVAATPETSSTAAILEEVALALGIRAQGLHPARLRRLCDGALKATRGLLIIDEAQFLQKNACETLRGFHDRLGIGLAFMGNVAVFGRLYGTGVRAEEFAQLSSRVGTRLPLLRPKAGDVHAIAAAFGIDGSAKWSKSRDYLERIAMKPGGLREVAKTLRLAATLAIGAGAPLGLDFIQAAWMERHGHADAASEEG
jgi:DNA transposition AAA+ family ATPase